MRRAILSALLLSTFAVPALAAHAHRAPAPADAGVAVPMDEVRIVTFKEPIATVFMGNSTIADVNVIDSRHAFVLGKSFGETNLIALGVGGRQIANEHVTVSGRRMGAVTLNRGNAQFSYTCTKAHCEAQSVPGDDKNYFDATHNAVGQNEDQGIKSASNGGGTSTAQ